MKPGMRRNLTIALLSTVVLILTSCATTSSKIVFHEVPPKDNNDAVVYVYRLPYFPGSAVTFSVKLDGKEVAVLKQNAYAVLYITPGEHLITIGDPGNIAAIIIESSLRDSRKFTAVPNGVYFLRCKGGVYYYVTKEEAMKEIVEMKFDMGL